MGIPAVVVRNICLTRLRFQLFGEFLLMTFTYFIDVAFCLSIVDVYLKYLKNKMIHYLHILSLMKR